MPFQLVEPILKRMPAKQLYEIEQKCPQIQSASQQLWKDLIMRDFSDRPVPESHFRKVYGKYYKERQEHLKTASQRLRETTERLKREREATKITSLAVDPRAARSTARYKASKAAPPGMRAVQKAFADVKMRGPRFSSGNLRFKSGVATGSTGLPSVGGKQNEAESVGPRSSAQGVSSAPSQKRPLEWSGESAEKVQKTDDTPESPRKVVIKKKAAPSIFLRSRR